MPESTVPHSGRIRPSVRGVIIGDVTRAEDATGAPVAPTDEELMAGLADGETGSLEQLYDRYSSLVFSVSLRVLDDRQLAEDVTQEVFLRLWRQPRSYDAGRGRFLSWLMSVTRNRAIDEQRRITRRRRVEKPGDDATSELPGPERFHDPQLEAVLAEDRRRVRQAMTRLPPPQREVIELAYFSGLTQTQIARRTGEPLGTVKTRIRLGMRKLRGALEEPRGKDDGDTGGA